MFLVLLWLGLFLDVLTSFSLETSKINANVHLNTIKNENFKNVPTTTTILVPRAIPDEEQNGYPSPLHYIHVRSLLTNAEVQTCHRISQEYAAQTGRWDAPDEIRHQTYPTCDFPVDECETLLEYLKQIDFDNRLWSNLSELYGIDLSDMNYLDLFVAHYQAKNEDDATGTVSPTGSLDRLELHRDGSLLSFSLLLNSPTEFTGGGTFYDALRDVVIVGSPTNCTSDNNNNNNNNKHNDTCDKATLLHPGGVIRPLRAGDACLHCGKLLHGADTVTSGSRTVLVGFIEVAERCYRPGVLAKACTDWGRMDVAAFRHRRQMEQGNGWVINHTKWFTSPQQEKTQHSHSSVFKKGYIPAFESVQRRADPAYQRRKKLEAEDILLRTILLPPEERPKDLWDQGITIP